MSDQQPQWPSPDQLEAGYSAVHNHLAALEGLGALRQALDMARQAAATREVLQTEIAQLTARAQELRDAQHERERAEQEHLAQWEARHAQQQQAWAEELQTQEARIAEAKQRADAAVRETNQQIAAHAARLRDEGDKVYVEVQEVIAQLQVQRQGLEQDVGALRAQKDRLEAELRALVGRVSI